MLKLFIKDELVFNVLSFAQTVGLIEITPVVLSDGGNLIIHLAPHPVVARISTVISKEDANRAYSVFNRELNVAKHLNATGVPVLLPVNSLGTRPYDVNGTWQMLFGGLSLLLLSFIMESPHLVINETSLWVILYLAIMGSIVQFATWYYLLSHSDPGKTSAFLFLAPFFGVLSGFLILSEKIHWYVYLGGLCIFTGIFLVNWTTVGKKELESFERRMEKPNGYVYRGSGR